MEMQIAFHVTTSFSPQFPEAMSLFKDATQQMYSIKCLLTVTNCGEECTMRNRAHAFTLDHRREVHFECGWGALVIHRELYGDSPVRQFF